MPLNLLTHRTTQPASSAVANNATAAGISRPAVPVNKPVAQLTKRLTYAVGTSAVVRASANSKWMTVQGLQDQGYPQWHLTIFPINQESWSHSFKLPADGSRPVQEWMKYDEFHFTSPEGDHFFYTDGCVPLRGSQESRGKSPAWQQREKWAVANWICYLYFGASYEALQQYVQERPRAEEQEAKAKKAEEQYQENLWDLYKNSVRLYPEWHKKENLDLDSWANLIRAGFQGTDEQFKLQIADEVNGMPDPKPDRVWVEDEEGYGYKDEKPTTY